MGQTIPSCIVMSLLHWSMFTILDITESAQYPPVQSSPTIDKVDKISLPDSGQVSEGEDDIDVVTLDVTHNVPMNDTSSSSSNSSMSSSSDHEKEDESLDTCK